jgi:hypothetical protein
LDDLDPWQEIDVDDFTHERWLAVVGWEGLYEVSDLGRVRSLPRRGTVQPNRWYGGKILKPQPVNESGHLCVTLCRDGVDTKALVHRLVMAAFAGPCPEGEEVRHLDGDPSDNRLIRLAYGTRTQNNLDAVEHGTHYNARKTHCIRNHEFTPENTFIGSHGERCCRTCHNDSTRERARERYAIDPEYRERERARSAASMQRTRDRRKAAREAERN